MIFVKTTPLENGILTAFILVFSYLYNSIGVIFVVLLLSMLIDYMTGFNFSVSGGSSGGSGISDVPLDNKSYVRKNQNWSELTELSEPVGGNIDGGTF